jgi:hypothetical protein
MVDAFAASALLWLAWLAAVCLKLGAPQRSRTLRRHVCALERAVEAIVLLMATLRLRPPPQRRRHPRSAPAGFHRRPFKRNCRLLMKHARICDRRLSLLQRVERLIEALADPERFIARFIARLRRGLIGSRLLIVAPAAARCAGLACPAVEAIDDS